MPTLQIAGHAFACKAVACFHGEKGRASFTVALDDPSDASHIIAFSGEHGRRTKDDLYLLAVDRMELNSSLPVPELELSAGACRQNGNFSAAAGVLDHLHRDRQEGPAVPAAIRIWRHAGHSAAGPDVRASRRAASHRPRKRAPLASNCDIFMRLGLGWLWQIRTSPKEKLELGQYY